jgi:hypothetical protein
MDGALPARNPQELFAKAPIIVEATVQSVFPAEKKDYGTDGRLQTDSILRVDRLIRGENMPREVVVSQWGGTLNGKSDVPYQYSLMQPGERYIVLLVKTGSDTSRLGIPSYIVYGEFFGLIRLDGEKLGFSRGVPPQWQAVFAGMGASRIIETFDALAVRKQ